MYGTQLAIHFMRKNPTPGGRIVATASAAALYPHETYPEYDGAKAAVLNFVRATGRVLRIVSPLFPLYSFHYEHVNTLLLQKENIAINAVLPGIVHTNIIPPEMVAAVSPEAMTPVSAIVSAYVRFLDHEDASLSGEALECAADKQIFCPRPEYLNGNISQRACTVWDVSLRFWFLFGVRVRCANFVGAAVV